MTRNALRLSFATLAVLAMAGSAFAQSNVTIENFSTRFSDAKTSLAISRIDAVDTNLTRDELSRMFSGDTPRDDALAIAARMKAAKLTVTGAVASDADAKLTFGPLEATGIENGKFGKATLASVEGTFAGKEKSGGGTFTGRALTIEQGNFGPLLRAIQTKDVNPGSMQIGRLTWDGFDGAFADTNTPADTPGGNLMKVSLRGLTMSTEYQGDTPVASKGELSGFTLMPAVGSEFGKSIRAFGYDKIDVSVAGSGRYDPSKQKLAIEQYAITSPNAGRLTISGDMSGIDPAALSSRDASQRGLALLGASVENLRVNFVNEGLVDKSFAFAAAKQGKTPAALRSETSAMATQLLPLLLGGDPQSLELAQSVQTFLATPRSFDLTLKARGAPVPLARLGAIRDPATFLALVEVNLKANQ